MFFRSRKRKSRDAGIPWPDKFDGSREWAAPRRRQRPGEDFTSTQQDKARKHKFDQAGHGAGYRALYCARDISTTDALLSLEKFGHRNPQRVGDSGDIAERGISQAEFNAPGYVR